MKRQKNKNKSNFFKKIFIKICRLIGYEIIDQSNFYVPTQDKSLNKNLSTLGNKSIVLPLGETKISRKVLSLTVVFRSCTNVNLATQNKMRLFEAEKSEYTFRALNSLIKSLNDAHLLFPNIKFDMVVIDHNSKDKDINQIKKQLSKGSFNTSFVSLDTNLFQDKIKLTNEKNKKITDNMISNMSSIYKSIIVAKDNADDLIYLVEDDYLHQNDTITEMLYTYERLSSQLNQDIVLCPADYPYLYTKSDSTNIFLGSKKHWRKIDETLLTFLLSKNILIKHWNKFTSMCEFEHDPFEKPLHDLYKAEQCFSPIPSLALHFTNVNSIFGLSPNVDWEKIWKENDNYNG
jgi:hypothetical protein